MNSPLPGLRGKVAIVTGHAQGIGRAVHELLGKFGCTVHGFDLPERDLRKLDRIAGWVDAVAAEAGRIDILVNNAGITNVGDIVDPIAILQPLFLGAPPAPPPYPACGTSAREPSDAFCVFTGCEPAP